MNIKTLTALVPAKFEYKYFDTEGNEQSDTINLKLRRMSFATAERELGKLKDDETSIDAMAQILGELIAEWDLYTDETEKEVFPISAEWFAGKECPYAFVMGLSACVVERMQGNPPKAATSPNGSEPAAPSSQESGENSTSVTDSPTLAASGA